MQYGLRHLVSLVVDIFALLLLLPPSLPTFSCDNSLGESSPIEVVANGNEHHVLGVGLKTHDNMSTILQPGRC